MERVARTKTESIDVAAYIETVTNHTAEIAFQGAFASFTFPADESTRNALIDYQTGGQAEAKILLEKRGRLFARIKTVWGGRHDPRL